jgi:RNA polymerase sigma-70 factor (ECF subfamily)
MSDASQLTREILDQHAAFVRTRLRRLGVPADALDDATQDVFEVLVRRIAEHDPERPLRAWLSGIARHVARRHYERPRFPPEPPQRELDLSPEERAARAQAWGLLERFVGELEPERWSVFVLSEIEGLRASEIARELGQNPNTVVSRLRSARTSFERVLRRHHARERRSLALAPQLAHGNWGTWTLACVATSFAVMLGAPRCWMDDPDWPPAGSNAPRTAERVDLQPAHATSLDPRVSDPANERAPASAFMNASTNAFTSGGWHVAGHGFSSLGGGTLSHELRYRLDGSTLTFETSYLADDDITASVAGHIELAGLERTAGDLAWQESLSPGQTRVLQLQAHASREGVVSLRLTHTHAAAGASSKQLRWMHAGGVLRDCVDLE